jgi:hypothetical protein
MVYLGYITHNYLNATPVTTNCLNSSGAGGTGAILSTSRKNIPSDCTNEFHLITGDQGFVLNPFSVSQFSFTGGVAIKGYYGGGGGYNGAFPDTDYGLMSVEFMTDAPKVYLNYQQQYYGTSITAAGWATQVNGYPIAAKHGLPAVSFQTLAWLQANAAVREYSGSLFDWSTKPKRARRVRFYTAGVFTGLFIPPQYNVWAPVNPNRYRLLLEGDSFAQGGAPSNGYAGHAQRLANMLGCDDVLCTGQGGSGYINVGGDGTNMLTRISKVINMAPDIMFVMPTAWDSSATSAAYTTAVRLAQYKLYFTALFNALPNIICIVTGDRSSSSQVNADMLSFVNSFGNPHLIYVDVHNGATTTAAGVGRAWYSGDGSVDTVGTVQGNSQWHLGASGDGHPNVRGVEAACQFMYDAIVKVMNTLTD